MSLPPGTRLGPYEIVAPIGAGGMGEVYRARDPRLGRDVAVKVLPASFSSDPERMRRFEQEARAAGLLNHPNVTAVYDIGTVDGSPYVVSELLEGETLRARLAGGPLAPRRAVDYAIQTAHGLAAAHEKGIIHRDLKPENLFVTKDGRVKILDFGLAKLTQRDGDGSRTDLPTTPAGTEPGVVMGTLGYMSPEQVRGRPADARSDIFSFGAILYEMLSGNRAFHRDTAADTMSAILREDPPDLSSTNRQVSPGLDRIIRHCLEKDPESRFHSAHDLAFQLEASTGSEPVPLIPAAPRRTGSRFFLPLLGALVITFAAVLATLFARRTRVEAPAAMMRFAIPVPAGTVYAPGEISRGLAISPDGTRLVVEAISEGRRHLYVRPIDSEKFMELEGTTGASAPFWSPDGRSIAFFADGKLKRIPATGGPAQELCTSDFGMVGTWNRDGTILFQQISPPGIIRIADTGGDPVPITALDSKRKEVAHLWPLFLPDGRRFLYEVSRAGTEQRELWVASLDSKERRLVGPIHSRFEYAPPGALVYVRDGALFAQEFDQEKVRFLGEPRLLAESIRYFYGPSHASFSVSGTGVVAYENAPSPSRLLWFDRAGRELGELGQPAVLRGFRISPDGSRLAASIEDLRHGTADVWIFDLRRGVSTRLHSTSVDEKSPVWSADGSRVLYRSDLYGPPDITEIAVGSAGGERLVLQDAGVQQPEDVSADGRVLVYLNALQGAPEIRLLPLSPGAKPALWLRIPFGVSNPRFSPDGRWIVYESEESGRPEVYVARTEGGGEKRRLSPAGGRRPRWRHDGREIDYLALEGTVMSVALDTTAGLEAAAPVPLFRVESEIQDFDVLPDGSRFLVSTTVAKVPETPLRVIVNWEAALKSAK